MSVIGPEELVGDLPEELQGRIKAEVSPGERVLWAACGGPIDGATASTSWTGLFIGAGFWVASALLLAAFFGAFGSRFRQVEDFLAGAGVLAGIIGLLCVLGMVGSWIDRRAERKRRVETLFALTDQRVIFWKGQPGTAAIAVYSYPLSSIHNVHRVEMPDGSGSVRFSIEPKQTSWDGSYAWERPTGFEGIPDVRRVEALVREHLGSAAEPRLI